MIAQRQSCRSQWRGARAKTSIELAGSQCWLGAHKKVLTSHFLVWEIQRSSKAFRAGPIHQSNRALIGLNKRKALQVSMCSSINEIHFVIVKLYPAQRVALASPTRFNLVDLVLDLSQLIGAFRICPAEHGKIYNFLSKDEGIMVPKVFVFNVFVVSTNSTN